MGGSAGDSVKDEHPKLLGAVGEMYKSRPTVVAASEFLVVDSSFPLSFSGPSSFEARE